MDEGDRKSAKVNQGLFNICTQSSCITENNSGLTPRTRIKRNLKQGNVWRINSTQVYFLYYHIKKNEDLKFAVYAILYVVPLKYLLKTSVKPRSRILSKCV